MMKVKIQMWKKLQNTHTHTHSVDVLDFRIYDATAGHSHVPHMKGKEQVQALTCPQNHTKTETPSEFPFMIFKKLGPCLCFREVNKAFRFETHTEADTWRRHGGELREDHGKGIFSTLQLVSPGRQDWWRDGSISCSINAFCLRVVHVCCFLHEGDTMWLSRGLWQEAIGVCLLVFAFPAFWGLSWYLFFLQ